MNILVTGAGGFIGRRLARKLGSEHKVYGLIHDLHPWPEKWIPLQGDIQNYPRMLEILVDREIHYVYHLAAKSIVRNCKSDPIGCFQTNVMGTVNILEAARHSDTVQGVMCAESDKSYGSGPVPYVEDQALRPGSVYEASKACVTHVARAFFENYGVPVFTVRSANVYGPGDENMTRLIPNTITRLLRGEAPQITAGAERFVREFFFLDDFVETSVALMEKRPWGEAFNVGTGETMTVDAVVRLICELVGRTIDFEEWPRPSGLVEIAEQVLCLDKLNQWVPGRKPRGMREGLVETIRWYKDNLRCPWT